MVCLSLDGKWRFRRTDSGEWLGAAVPGSVFHELLSAGKIEDPFYRENELAAKEIASYDYEYERDFTAEKDMLSCRDIILRCDGLDTLADVFINGILSFSSYNMHRIYEADVRSLIREGQNTIRILLHSPVKYIEEKNLQNPLWGSSDAIAGFPHLRKGHSMFGWDWGPRIPDSGIWRSISLIGFDRYRLDDVHILQKHANGAVELDVRVGINMDAAEEDEGKLSIRVVLTIPDGDSFTQEIRLQEKEGHIPFLIYRPELWWPNGYGKQPLYRVKTVLRKDGKDVDSREHSIGLRTIGVKKEKDEWGESFAFEINGSSIFAMGADYIPEDSLLPRCSPERTEKLIQSCVAANFNFIRIWGGGYYPEDYFYELCDRYGLLVWQDFMFACAEYELTDEFAENIAREAEDNVKRLRHHASLAIWCGNNEMEAAWAHWDFPKTEEHRNQYLRMFEEILPTIAAKYDPQTFYWPSSPSSGGGFDSPNDENRGDVHYWDVWHGLKPFTEYRNFRFRFVSEFGFQSFPGRKTVESFTLPEDRNIFSCVMENHQKNGAANGKILYYLSENFLYPRDFESLLYTSQLLQAEAIKYGVEHWRRHRGRCMGTLYWQLNDCWPVASWASIDYFGRWKTLHYFAKRFYAPVLLSACEEGLKASLHVTNESRKEFRGEVRWKLRDRRSDILRSGTEAIVIGALNSSCICSLDFSDVLTDREKQRSSYLEFGLYRDSELVSGGSVLFVKNKQFDFLDPEMECEISEAAEEYVVRVQSKSFARYVGLDLERDDCIFSDNYFDLSAGEARYVKVRKRDLSRPISLLEFREQLRARSIFDLA